MSSWMRRMLGTLALGGGTLVIVSSINSASQIVGVIGWIIVLVFAAFYLFGIWCGISILEGRPRAADMNSMYWWLQVPMLKTYFLCYFLMSGVRFTFWCPWSFMDAGFQWQLGSAFFLFLFKQPDVSGFGLNLFALAMLFCLRRGNRPESAQAPAAQRVIEER